MSNIEIVKDNLEYIKEVSYNGFITLIIDKNNLVKSINILQRFDFNFLLDLAGIDYLDYEGSGIEDSSKERFGLVYLFKDIKDGSILTLKITIAKDEEVVTISNIYRSANWLEREIYDQYGIKFKGHKNLKRLLNHSDFVGHPLRKDYNITDGQPCYNIDTLNDDILLDCKERGIVSEDSSFENIRDNIETELMFLNIGPSHPATHGTIRTLVALDGERIVSSATEIGYLHRGFEKSCENHTYNQIIPYTDRLNYCSAIVNNISFALTIEKMLDIKVPEQAVIMRVVLLELQRIMDHLVCLAALCIDSGALTNFWYLFNEREDAYSFISKLTGARLTNSFARVGGMSRNFYIGWKSELTSILENINIGVSHARSLLEKNRIFLDRVDGVCIMSKDDIKNYSLTGPIARASGIDVDLRKIDKDFDYSSYDFSIALGSNGDLYDRIFVRFEEINESLKIVNQAMDRVKEGPIHTDRKDIFLPEYRDVKTSIEGMINHFKLIFEGVKVPKGEYYSSLESPNGELGFYVVSDGSGVPHRVRVRPPSFFAIASHSNTIIDSFIADSILNLGSLNIIAGESDR